MKKKQRKKTNTHTLVVKAQAIVLVEHHTIECVVTSGSPRWSAMRYIKAAARKDGLERYAVPVDLRMPRVQGKPYLNLVEV